MRALIALFGAALCFAGCAHKPFHLSYEIEREVLPNGVTVLYVRDESVPVVSFSTLFKVGSVDETAGKSGIAHLFEHLMFKGTKKYGPKQFFVELERVGATVNAFTQRNATVYYETLASEHLERAIEMEADRIANIRFEQKDLDNERKVVLAERRLRIDNKFQNVFRERFEEALYSGHVYGKPIIGYPTEIKALTLQDLNAFFQNFYNPRNIIVTVAGGFEMAHAKSLMRKYFAPIKMREVKREATAVTPPVAGPIRRVMQMPVEGESLLIGFRGPSMYSDDAPKLTLLAWALFGMDSSLGNITLVREKQLALDVDAAADMDRAGGGFVISVDVKHGIAVESVEEEVDSLIKAAADGAISDSELLGMKNKMIYSMIRETLSPSGVANWLATGEYYWDDYRRIDKLLDRYQRVTAKDLRDVARKYLSSRNRVVFVLKRGA